MCILFPLGHRTALSRLLSCPPRSIIVMTSSHHSIRLHVIEVAGLSDLIGFLCNKKEEQQERSFNDLFFIVIPKGNF